MKVRSNHAFCTDWVLRQGGSPRVLDYGCGAGETVDELRSQGVEAYGCDVFYGGGDRSALVAPDLYEQGAIRRMEGSAIPFADATFDLVFSNQVLEHVENLEQSLAEMARVLKPGGRVLSLFPHREAWFEFHVGLPFVHWFPTGSRWRFRYALVMRALGFGSSRQGKRASQWCASALDYLDKWTHYRTRAEIDRAFAAHFITPRRLEAQWLGFKFADGPAVRAMPAWIRRIVTTSLAGLVFECEKPQEPSASSRNRAS